MINIVFIIIYKRHKKYNKNTNFNEKLNHGLTLNLFNCDFYSWIISLIIALISSYYAVKNSLYSANYLNKIIYSYNFMFIS